MTRNTSSISFSTTLGIFVETRRSSRLANNPQEVATPILPVVEKKCAPKVLLYGNELVVIAKRNPQDFTPRLGLVFWCLNDAENLNLIYPDYSINRYKPVDYFAGISWLDSIICSNQYGEFAKEYFQYWLNNSNFQKAYQEYKRQFPDCGLVNQEIEPLSHGLN